MKKRAAAKAVMLLEALLIISCVTADDRSDTGAQKLPAAAYIENASMETFEPNSGEPVSWSTDTWGDHTATFSCMNEGHSGGHCVKTIVTNYQDGDAKWFFDPFRLAPGDYRFIDYYRSDVETKVVAAIFMSSGDIAYIDMPDAPPSEAWIKYEAVFTVPKDAETVTVYHLLSQNGVLITDDYCIAPYQPVGFDRGLVTITFDDGWEENAETALPIMREFGFQSNQFYATTYIEHPCVSDPKERILRFIHDGHEIGSHSVTHPDLVSLTSQQVTEELADSKAFLEDTFGVHIRYFASPYGSYDTEVNEAIMKHYSAHRTVDSGYNSKDNFDVTRLKCESVLRCTTPEQVAEWVDKAKGERVWLILLYHKVTGDPDRYDTTPERFREQMQAIKTADIPVVTISEALSELDGQLVKKPENAEVAFTLDTGIIITAGIAILLLRYRAKRAGLALSRRVRKSHTGDSGSSRPHTSQ